VCNLYTTGLAAATGLNLGLYNNGSTDSFGSFFGFFRGVCDATCENWNAILLE
jgi:hypothetical protein